MKTHMHKLVSPSYSLMLLSFVFALGACSNTRETLGLNRDAPDEFAVVKRAPLAMPPSYQLQPPRPGTPRPQEQGTRETAQRVVFGTEPETQSNPRGISAAEDALLQEAGAHAIDPSIRRVVDSETSQIDETQQPVVDRILGWGSVKSPASVVDAKKEAERLKKNAEEGKSVSDGETPTLIK